MIRFPRSDSLRRKSGRELIRYPFTNILRHVSHGTRDCNRASCSDPSSHLSSNSPLVIEHHERQHPPPYLSYLHSSQPLTASHSSTPHHENMSSQLGVMRRRFAASLTLVHQPTTRPTILRTARAIHSSVTSLYANVKEEPSNNYEKVCTLGNRGRETDGNGERMRHS